MTRITVVKIVGSSNYADTILQTAQKYEHMGCLVLISCMHDVYEGGDIHDHVMYRQVEMADIVHIIQPNHLDIRSHKLALHAKFLQKAICYNVPQQAYLNTFNFKDDQFIIGPIRWLYNDKERYLADGNGKRVYIFSEERELIL